MSSFQKVSGSRDQVITSGRKCIGDKLGSQEGKSKSFPNWFPISSGCSKHKNQ